MGWARYPIVRRFRTMKPNMQSNRTKQARAHSLMAADLWQDNADIQGSSILKAHLNK